MVETKYSIGDIVTLKSHPLAFQDDGEIDAYVNQIPPFMCVKEIHIEKKKQKFSQELNNVQIADNVKYLCVYFNQHRMIFEEKYIYQEMLIPITEITFHRESNDTMQGDQNLLDETKSYKNTEYEFGKRVFFKTYKLEKRKKFVNIRTEYRSPTKTSSTHTSPAFILNGYKINDQKSIYNQKSGDLQRKCSKELFKVIWYNAYQEKFSEDYVPREFLTDDSRIYSNEMRVRVEENGQVFK